MQVRNGKEIATGEVSITDAVLVLSDERVLFGLEDVSTARRYWLLTSRTDELILA